MTEEAFQAARAIMRSANYIRGMITAKKVNLSKWANILYEHNKKGTVTDKVKQAHQKAYDELQHYRDRLAYLQFPDPNMKEPIRRCKECHRILFNEGEYCGITHCLIEKEINAYGTDRHNS